MKNLRAKKTKIEYGETVSDEQRDRKREIIKLREREEWGREREGDSKNIRKMR